MSLTEIELVITHQPRSEFDELKHPEFFDVTGDSAGTRAIAESAQTAPASAVPASVKQVTEVSVLDDGDGDDATAVGHSNASFAGHKRRRDEE